MDLDEATALLAEHPLVADVTLSVDGDGLVTASVVPLDPFRVPRLADLLSHLGRDAARRGTAQEAHLPVPLTGGVHRGTGGCGRCPGGN